MLYRRVCSAAIVLALCLVGAHGAVSEKAPYDGYLVKDLSFNALNLPFATHVSDVLADTVNRVWFAAGSNGGVVALAGTEQAPFFPLTTRDGLLASSVSSVAFGLLGGQENFFLGFGDKGIQYGRVLSDTGLSPKPPGELALSTAESLVDGLASDGSQNLWAATKGGLVWWTIGGASPTRHTPDTLRSGDAISHVATNRQVSNSPLVFSDAADGKLYVLPYGGTVEHSFYDLGDVVGFAFDGSRSLWVAAGTASGNGSLYRFSEGSDLARPFETVQSFPFGGLRALKSIAVDPLVPGGPVVWVGTDQGAYFRRFDEVSSSFVDADWIPAATGATDANVRVYVDPSGNVYFGSSFGVRSLLSRLLTLSSSRFVGYGATATVTLRDVGILADASPPVVYVVKEKGGTSSPELTLPTTRNTDGSFTASFGFAAATVPGEKLGVTSAATDTAFEVVYLFGPDGAQKELPRARFTWANIVPFDDDAWVGNACFLGSLGFPCTGR